MATQVLSELAARLNHLADSAGVPDAELLRRFVETRDEAAFELLVWRHGGLVLGTCCRVLGRSADAEDAFQAVFLVLARKASAVRESLGGWLHRVALRVATRQRATTSRRARVESQPLPESIIASPEPLPDDTAAVLDEEIGQLPDKLRVAFVLCHLQGHTHAEAATQLGCPRGTVLSRVARARERLQARLARRGIAVAGALAVVSAPTLSAALVADTIRASIPFATGKTVLAASAPAVSLAHGILRKMMFDLWKPIATVAAVAVLAVGVVLAAHAQFEAPPPLPVMPQFVAAPVPPRPPANFKLDLNDRVVRVDRLLFSPDGKWVVVEGVKPNGKKKPDKTTDSALVVCEVATGKYVQTFAKPAEHIQLWPKAFSPDGKLFATESSDNHSVMLWSTGNWKEHVKLDHLLPNTAAFSPDSKTILTTVAAMQYVDGDFNGPYSHLKAWDVATGKLVWEQESKTEEEALVFQDFAPDSKTILGSTQVGSVRVLDAKTGKQRTVIQTPEREVIQTEISRDGAKLLTWIPSLFSSKEKSAGSLRLWNIATGKQEQQFEGVDRLIHYACFSPDGKLVVALSGNAVSVWDAATGKKVARFALLNQADDFWGFISVTPDSKAIMVCIWSKMKNDSLTYVSVFYSLPNGKELARLPGARMAMFSPDGKTVAIVSGPLDLRSRDDKLDVQDTVTIRDLAELLKSGR